MGAPVRLPPAADGRALWVDRAKAISILLVVAWHTAGDRYLLNLLLQPARIPLFFFVAGFFSARSLPRPWKEFLAKKVFHFIYLYALWCIIQFAVMDALPVLGTGEVPYGELLAIFWDPPLTLWFIYALAIVFLLAKLFHRLNPMVLFSGLALIYLAVSFRVSPSESSIIEKVSVLAPFFALGAVSYPFVARHIGRVAPYWLPIAIAFFAIAYVSVAVLPNLPPATLAASLLGILAICSASYAMEGTLLARFLNWVGGRTIMIYVLHRSLIFHVKLMLPLGLIGLPVLRDGLVLTITVILAAVLGFVLDRYLPWLFNSPWNMKAKSSNKYVAPPSEKVRRPAG